MDTDVTPPADTTPRSPEPGASEHRPDGTDAPAMTTHVVVMGVAGSGKTTVARLLAERSGRPFAEADEFHPQSNIDKMSAGTPLTDDDRKPWLEAIRDWLSGRTDAGESVVVTCSALKRTYRDVLRAARGDVVFVYLEGSEEVLAERMQGRSGHFMPPSLLPSQLATLEPLADDEAGVTLDVREAPDDLVAAARAWLETRHPA